jgi:hypothetical protein
VSAGETLAQLALCDRRSRDSLRHTPHGNFNGLSILLGKRHLIHTEAGYAHRYGNACDTDT